LLGWIEEASLAQKANGRVATPENTASVVSWAIFGAGMEWSRRNGGARSAEEFADEVLSVIVEGLQL
jgi:phosphoserine aminotransferase